MDIVPRFLIKFFYFSDELVEVEEGRVPVALDPVEDEVAEEVGVGLSEEHLLAGGGQHFDLDEREIADGLGRRHRRYLQQRWVIENDSTVNVQQLVDVVAFDALLTPDRRRLGRQGSD